MKVRKHGGTTFHPLATGSIKRANDNRCCCVYCSATGKSTDPGEGIWDTVACSIKTGETWLVHYPELRGKIARRA